MDLEENVGDMCTNYEFVVILLLFLQFEILHASVLLTSSRFHMWVQLPAHVHFLALPLLFQLSVTCGYNLIITFHIIRDALHVV